MSSDSGIEDIEPSTPPREDREPEYPYGLSHEQRISIIVRSPAFIASRQDLARRRREELEQRTTNASISSTIPVESTGVSSSNIVTSTSGVTAPLKASTVEETASSESSNQVTVSSESSNQVTVSSESSNQVTVSSGPSNSNTVRSEDGRDLSSNTFSSNEDNLDKPQESSPLKRKRSAYDLEPNKRQDSNNEDNNGKGSGGGFSGGPSGPSVDNSSSVPPSSLKSMFNEEVTTNTNQGSPIGFKEATMTNQGSPIDFIVDKEATSSIFEHIDFTDDM
jgi:hypothetical protein